MLAGLDKSTCSIKTRNFPKSAGSNTDVRLEYFVESSTRDADGSSHRSNRLLCGLVADEHRTSLAEDVDTSPSLAWRRQSKRHQGRTGNFGNSCPLAVRCSFGKRPESSCEIGGSDTTRPSFNQLVRATFCCRNRYHNRNSAGLKRCIERRPFAEKHDVVGSKWTTVQAACPASTFMQTAVLR